uniref:Uncharacterized protein n=1 Tax=Rhizophora mucronata TaxID=61149 RepID=A0A2P2QYG9_RHIMU
MGTGLYCLLSISICIIPKCQSSCSALHLNSEIQSLFSY